MLMKQKPMLPPGSSMVNFLSSPTVYSSKPIKALNSYETKIFVAENESNDQLCVYANHFSENQTEYSLL